MLNAANENVLVAVDACQAERVVPVLGGVMRFTKPALERREVEPLLSNLISEGYVKSRAPGIACPTEYQLTERGDEYLRVLTTRFASSLAAERDAVEYHGGNPDAVYP